MNTQSPPPLFLTIAGMVNQEMSARVFQTLSGAIRDGYQDVHLLIQSTGGFIGDGIGIFNFLSNLPIKITTYNIGYVASIAVPIYLAGSNRVCAETATFMIHRPHNTNVGGTTNTVIAAADSLRIDEKRCGTILKSFLKLPEEQWAIYANNDLTFSSSEAIKYGASHSIGMFVPVKGAPIFNI